MSNSVKFLSKYLKLLSNCQIVLEILSYSWLLADMFLNYTLIVLELMSTCFQLLSKISLNVDQFSIRSRVDVEMFEFLSKLSLIVVNFSKCSRNFGELIFKGLFAIELLSNCSWLDVEILSNCYRIIEFLSVTRWIFQIMLSILLI